MISFILKNWKWLSAVFTALILVGYIAWQDHEITNLERKLLASQASAASYEKSLAELQTDTKAKIEALENENNQSVTRAKELERLLGTIEGADDEKDGPCAPVLCDTIKRLYGKPADTSKSD
ncbi:MAG TPA: hypothetical protein PK513_03955 [Alphaproteobacteria bacterium]|jgi:predicted negative regulator of RcsB-dependent stress response|nr:hypothetical protein [Alphaproteobacteria bacterium]USO05700.1 MAG: hypothetical protein H6859_00390 [Rhodospirillales bacterium]HOO81637.1 hypothetical protein [Alphaproteobacteria bacterium]